MVDTPSVYRNYANGNRLEILKSHPLIWCREPDGTTRVNAVYGERCSEKLSAVIGIDPETNALRMKNKMVEVVDQI